MGNLFPRWTNVLPLKLIVAGAVVLTAGAASITMYWTQGYSRVGYQPEQPIPFDHSLHSGKLGLDCRYCHSHVENASHSNIPSSQTCWNCHQHVKAASPKLEPLRRAMDPNHEHYTGEPIEWVRVHKLADYAYFNHQVHVNRGVSCVSCHGKVNEMEVVYHDQRLSMGWCLDCHRNPSSSLRPLDQVTNLDWDPAQQSREEFYQYLSQHSGKPVDDHLQAAEAKGFDVQGELTQKEIGKQLEELWGVNPPESCSACHR